jgi:hypothetical protein
LYRDAIELPKFNSVYRVLSADSASKEGYSPTTVIFDELHAQPDRELFDVFSLAMGARGKLATLIAITTAGVRADRTGKDSIAFNLYQYGQACRYVVKKLTDDTFSWLGGSPRVTTGCAKPGMKQTLASVTSTPNPISSLLSAEHPKRSSVSSAATSGCRVWKRGSRLGRGMSALVR